MVCFKSIMKSKLQVCLAFKTQSPSKLRWRLRVEVTHTCCFETEDLILCCSGDPRAPVVAALVGARFVESSSDYFSRQILYGVTGNYASTLGLTVLVLAVSALIACWIPARRAVSIDPIVALRQ